MARTLPILGVCLLMCTGGWGLGNRISLEEKLIGHLPLSSSAHLYPAEPRAGEESVQVNCSRFILDRIIGLDQKTQELEILLQGEFSWYDERLSWTNEAEFAAIHELHIPVTNVWIPDIALVNGVGDQKMLDHIDDGNHMMFVRLQSNGLVRYQTYARLSSYCPLDVKMFPFDHQICMMMFSSWTMDSSTIQIINPEEIEWNEDLDENSDWILDGANSSSKTLYKDIPTCHSGNHSTVGVNTVESIGFEVAIHLHRRTHYYLYNVLVPIMTLSLLTLANIRIPARYYQDKVFMGLSTFIAQSWYLIMISPELPVTQMHLPLIAAVVVLSMAFTCVTLIISIVVIHIHHQAPLTMSRPPTWLTKMCRYVLNTHSTPQRNQDADGHQRRNNDEQNGFSYDGPENSVPTTVQMFIKERTTTASKQSQTVSMTESRESIVDDDAQNDDEGFCETSNYHLLSAASPDIRRKHSPPTRIKTGNVFQITSVRLPTDHLTGADTIPADTSGQRIRCASFTTARDLVEEYRLSLDRSSRYSRRYSRLSRISNDNMESRQGTENDQQNLAVEGFLTHLDPDLANLCYILLMYSSMKIKKEADTTYKDETKTKEWEMVANAIDVIFFWASTCIILLCIVLLLVLNNRRYIIC